MKRPLFLFAISLVCGILIAKATQSCTLVFLLIVFLLFLLKIFSKNIKERVPVIIGVVVFFSVGAFEYIYIDRGNINRFKGYEGKQVVVEGYICSEPDIRESCIVYTVKTERIRLLKEKNSSIIKGKILLTTLKSDDGSGMYDYEERLQICGQLNLPAQRRNPGGFNYRQYLAQSGISACVFATSDEIVSLNSVKGNILMKTGLDLRRNIIDIINRSLPQQQAGLLAGMLIGYREGLSKQLQAVFSDSGLTHIMAVSGANVVFIVFPLLFLLKKLRVNCKAANVIVMGTLVLFVLITGFEPSVLRAVIMAEAALAGQIINRETEVINSISLAAVLLLIFNPYTLFNIGFQLSFAATISLVLFYPVIKEKISFRFLPKTLSDVLSATLAAQVGVLPISVFYFNKVSVISIISNIVVVPITGIITILGCIMAILGQLSIVISQAIGYINCAFLSFVLLAARISASVPFAVVEIVTPTVIMMLLYYAIIWFFLYYKPSRKIRLKLQHYLAFAVTLTMVFCLYAITPKNMVIIFMDVGEGDSILIKTYSGKSVLIDGGKGDTAVIPVLLDCRVSGLDAVMATHDHDDHVKGLIPVLKDFNVKALLLPDCSHTSGFSELTDIAKERKIDSFALAKGDKIVVDDNTFIEVLSPGKHLLNTKPSLNNTSLVLKLIYKDVSMLFTGDIEEEVEDLLVNEGDDIGAHVLKVPHHGSDTSTSLRFLDMVDPEAAVISVGRNSFGHPCPVVLKRLKDRGIAVFRTDSDGAVILETNGRTIKLKKTVGM